VAETAGTSGVSFTLGVNVIAIVIYWIRDIQNRMNGIDLSLLYKTVPPDLAGDRKPRHADSGQESQEGRRPALRGVGLPRVSAGLAEDAERDPHERVQGGRGPVRG
jgi:hypothetical protein